MSKKKGSQNRLKFFDRGNTRCPICLTTFTRGVVEEGLSVTLEHAPPKTLGGAVMCLTCADCNRSAGKNLDQAVAMRNFATAARKMGRGTKVELDIFGTKHTTYLSSDGITENDLDSRLASKPNVQRFLDDLGAGKLVLLAELERGPVWDVSKGITLTTKRPPASQIAVSWLRSAYLLVFSLLGQGGYRYAESEAIRPIREQIMNPGDELVPCLLLDLSSLYDLLPSGSKDIIILNNRHQPSFWIVKMGSMGVLLPHGGTANHYREVVELPDQIKFMGRLRWWKPEKFGKKLSFELSLREDSDQVDRDLFGSELTVSMGELEQRCIVVNQQGLFTTFIPFGPTTRRSVC